MLAVAAAVVAVAVAVVDCTPVEVQRELHVECICTERLDTDAVDTCSVAVVPCTEFDCSMVDTVNTVAVD